MQFRITMVIDAEDLREAEVFRNILHNTQKCTVESLRQIVQRKAKGIAPVSKYTEVEQG